MSQSIVLAAAESGGFNPLDLAASGALFWTLVIFLLALPFMWKMVFGPITQALAERDATATAAIQAAEKAGEEAEEARAAVEVALGEARVEASKLVNAAKDRAEVRERDIVDNARKESEAMIASARTAIDSEREKALSSIRDEVVNISLNAASKVLGRNVGSEDDRRMVTELVASPAAKPE
ncbi:MAG: F0F1 ATP synthase subunit B [Planctomycetes bacterium]|nr:F0F1 ATP synthase subunit B [Planctomycetota bacterium]